MIIALEICLKLRGILKAKNITNNSVCSLGFSLTTLEDVIHHLSEMTALIERLFIDICEGKKDTRILLRFLNNLCVEVAGELPVDNA